MARQKVTPGSLQLLFAEGGKRISFNPSNKMYSDEWQQVKQFNNAHFQDTATTVTMEWEDDVELPGVSVKWLSDDYKGGGSSQITLRAARVDTSAGR